MPGITRMHRDDLEWTGGSFRFEGADHGTPVSFFWVDNDRTDDYGPGLHTHDYDELFLLVEGRARFFTDTDEFEVGAGEVLVVHAGQPHGFKKLGDGPLRQIDIHLNDRLISQWIKG